MKISEEVYEVLNNSNLEINDLKCLQMVFRVAQELSKNNFLKQQRYQKAVIFNDMSLNTTTMKIIKVIRMKYKVA